MTELRTNPSLLEAMKKAATGRISSAQLRAQKVSYILGAVSDESKITKERVEEVLSQLEGSEA